MNTKFFRFMLCLVLLSAVVLCAVLFSQILRDRNELKALNSELTESFSHWNAVAEEKEAFQEELKDVRSELKEASVSYEESGSKVARRLEEIAQLEEEISGFH